MISITTIVCRDGHCGLVVFLAVFYLLIGRSQGFSVTTSQRPVVTEYLLTLADNPEPVASCKELTPDQDIMEDEVDEWYPTARRIFCFRDDDDSSCVTVRRTSFGCSKLGYTVWPGSIVLSLWLVYCNKLNASRVLELGAGVGLPCVVCRDVLSTGHVLATDFWYDESSEDFARSRDDFDAARLIPESWHKINLEYNVKDESKNASVRKIDFHNLSMVQAVKDSFQPDLVIGSELVYYPDDLPHLCNTLEIMLEGDCTLLLVLPSNPEEREALPSFLDWLKRKQDECDVHFTECELHQNQLGEESEAFNVIQIRQRHTA